MPDRQARVKVDDDVWRDFRLATQNETVANTLGRLVTREVERWRADRIRAASVDDRIALDALARARELHDELAAIVRYFERKLQAQRDWSP